MASEKEITLLSRVAANHLFLAQFEPLRASLLSLRKRHPDLASSFLRTIVSEGGQVANVHWSTTCPSPSHLVWLASLELSEPHSNRLQVEFLILMDTVLSKLTEESDTNFDNKCVSILSRLLDLGLKRLRGEKQLNEVSEEELTCLLKVFLKYAEIFDAISVNIRSQEALQEQESSACREGTEAIVRIQKSVQLANLRVIKDCLDSGVIDGVFLHLPFLHLDFGVAEEEYKKFLKELVMKCGSASCSYNTTFLVSRRKMSQVYAGLVQSSCTRLLQVLQVIQDEVFCEEVKENDASPSESVPLPLKKFLATAAPEREEYAGACMRDLYHYSRLSEKHVLELVVETSLSLIRKEQLQEASDVVSLFPLLYTLVAVLGWDMLPGNILLRRKLMWLCWRSKSKLLTAEKLSLHGKPSEKLSCIDHLCDLLCFQLDVANYIAHGKSIQPWDEKNMLFFSEIDRISSEEPDLGCLDSFVENLILERLSFLSPIRVLFEAVPEIKLKDAIKFIKSQPVSSDTDAQKRLRDMELAHMRYAIESAVFSLSYIGRNSDNEEDFQIAMSYQREMQSHIKSIQDFSRKVFMVITISSLLQIDHISINEPYTIPLSSLNQGTTPETSTDMVLSFIKTLLEIMRKSLPDMNSQTELLNAEPSSAGKQALEWRLSNARDTLDDFGWRFSLLQLLKPISDKWSWKEALVILRGSPPKLLTLCMQRGEFGIGEETVLRFSLPSDDKATLQLARWVAHASPKEDLDVSSHRDQLGRIATAFLYIDGATTVTTSRDKCRVLLDHARRLLYEIDTGKPSKVGPNYWDQIKEAALVSMMKRVIQRLQELLESEQSHSIQDLFVRYIPISPSNDTSKLSQMQRPLVRLHQTMDDAFQGKTQFLNGKLHNIAKALTDEDSDGTKKEAFCYKKGKILGLGFQVLKTGMKPAQKPITVQHISENGSESKESGTRIFTPLPANPSAYLSNFIIYIATVGDIFDGVDTTHNFNYFSLIYDWPKDLLTQLVFERRSSDAAEKAAEAMGVDFVHEVISSCVPPVFPPRSNHHCWAWMPILPTMSENNNSPKSEVSYKSALTTFQKPLYPLQLEVLKTLANLSPVRAVLAGVFGSSLLTGDSETERSFYEFALEQSERFPTLNRWIQVQSNLHRVSESALASKTGTEQKERLRLKRLREPEMEPETKSRGPLKAENLSTRVDPDYLIPKEESELTDACFDQNACISFDDDEGPYETAVQKLINDGKLMDALAVSDKCLRDGASDQLLQLLIESDEERHEQLQSSSHSYESATWQYCLRLREKELAAQLALKHLHKWNLDAAITVLSMCICHLPEADPLRNEIFHRRQALQRYRHILSADDRYNNWQEVEASCKADGEGLALRLASKGAVSAALEVAESASLSVNFRRELQGRQLVKLLTTDPLNGGGPAAASRFLSSLHDSDDALPVAIGAMELLPDLRSKQLLVHFFLKRTIGNLSPADVERLNSWALGLRVLALLPLPQQQKCSALHEHPRLILEVLLMMKQLQSAALVLKEFPSLRDDNLILKYAQKAIIVNVGSVPRENRISISSTRQKQKKLTTAAQPPKLSITESIGNLQKRAFSWGSRDNGGSSTPVKGTPNTDQKKRKSSNLGPTERASPEERSPTEGSERFQFVSVSEEWVLTGDPIKDDEVRLAHRYSFSPDITLFKALLSLCSDELVAAKGALNLCTAQMQAVLSSQYLPRGASMEILSRAYHATETYVQVLAYARSKLRKTSESGADTSSSSERSQLEGERASTASGGVNPSQGELPDLLGQAELWLGRAELLQSLLGFGISASLDDTADKDSSSRLRDRLIKDEQYSMAIYTCKKCKIDAFPVWNAWGHALIRMEHYAQARVKFKQAVQLYKGDATQVVLDIINTVEGSPPVDISSVRSMYENLAKSAASILDDSLSADAYLNVLYMPSTFPRSERSRQSMNSRSILAGTDINAGPRSNLDAVRYAECIHYLQEYARPQLLLFMFKHGHYDEACSLFLQSNFPPLQLDEGGAGPTSSIQRADSLTNDYGSVEDLCDLCIGYGAVPELAGTLKSSMESPTVQQDQRMKEHVLNLLIRICNYCETHRHFNYLYQFLVIRGDDVAAGLCCIQLFMNSMSQEEALKHLANAKMHFDEAALARDKPAGPMPRVVPKNATRIKSASDKMTREMIMKFSPRVSFQIDVVKALNAAEGPQWKTSLFGNPSDPETFRRRCVVVETLAEKHFNLAFQILHEFNLPAVDIYAGVVTNLGLKKRSREITEFLKNIKGTIDDDDWDQVVSTAISIYVTKHKERPDKLVDMIKSSHRKVLALVICGRLKGAFQVASRSGSVADVQYVAHQAMTANSTQVVDLCKNWLRQYM